MVHALTLFSSDGANGFETLKTNGFTGKLCKLEIGEDKLGETLLRYRNGRLYAVPFGEQVWRGKMVEAAGIESEWPLRVIA